MVVEKAWSSWNTHPLNFQKADGKCYSMSPKSSWLFLGISCCRGRASLAFCSMYLHLTLVVPKPTRNSNFWCNLICVPGYLSLIYLWSLRVCICSSGSGHQVVIVLWRLRNMLPSYSLLQFQIPSWARNWNQWETICCSCSEALTSHLLGQLPGASSGESVFEACKSKLRCLSLSALSRADRKQNIFEDVR